MICTSNCLLKSVCNTQSHHQGQTQQKSTKTNQNPVSAVGHIYLRFPFSLRLNVTTCCHLQLSIPPMHSVIQKPILFSCRGAVAKCYICSNAAKKSRKEVYISALFCRTCISDVCADATLLPTFVSDHAALFRSHLIYP